MSACLSTAECRDSAASILRLGTGADTGLGAHLLLAAGLGRCRMSLSLMPTHHALCDTVHLSNVVTCRIFR